MEAPRRFPVGAPRFLPCLHSGRGNLFPLFFMSQSITIIGIDPGSRNTGWGVVREVSGVLQLVDCGVIRPPLNGEFASRLGVIFKEMHRVLGRLKPDERSSSAKPAARPLRPVRPTICLCGTTNPR